MWTEFYSKKRIIRRATRHLRKYNITPPKIELKFTRQSPFMEDVRLVRRTRNTIDVECQFVQPETMLDVLRRRISTPVQQFLFCSPDVTELGLSIGDGIEDSINPFAYSSNREHIVLIPDPYQFTTNGFAKHRTTADLDERPWKSRNSTLRWRGTDTGIGRVSFDPRSETDATVLARIRLCTIAKSLPDIDCKIAQSVRNVYEPMYEHYGVLGGFIDEQDWINDRYALDIDGNTNTWSNMIARMHLGCCVLKVQSQFGFRQWYYDRIVPWEHFIPVEADLSDLGEKLDWARSNEDQAEHIAKNGQAFARTLTLESCTIEGAEIIETHYLGQPTDYSKEKFSN